MYGKNKFRSFSSAKLCEKLRNLCPNSYEVRPGILYDIKHELIMRVADPVSRSWSVLYPAWLFKPSNLWVDDHPCFPKSMQNPWYTLHHESWLNRIVWPVIFLVPPLGNEDTHCDILRPKNEQLQGHIRVAGGLLISHYKLQGFRKWLGMWKPQ